MSTEPNQPIWPSDLPEPHDDAPASPQPDTAAPAAVPMSDAERAAEREAFAELIAFINANKDADTEVTHLTADDYAATLE